MRFGRVKFTVSEYKFTVGEFNVTALW